MLTNYHTHTSRCGHAFGTDRDYVDAAVSAGMTALGFSDHSPYIFDGAYYSGHRMRPEETDGYVQSVRSLAREYADKITLLVGYEIEYYPDLFSRTLSFIAEHDCDYLILGQHFIGTEELYVGKMKNARDFERYISQTVEALETGLFTYLCHPDICQYPHDLKIQEKGFIRLCETAKRMNVPLELNMYGLVDNRHYPFEAFFRLAGEIGNIVVPGCDAHVPQRIGDAAELKATQAFAEKCGIQLTELSVEQVLARKSLIK